MQIRYVIVAYFKNQDFPSGIQTMDKGEFRDYPSNRQIESVINNIHQESFLYLKVEQRYMNQIKKGRLKQN